MWMMDGFKKHLKDKSKSKVLSSKSNPMLGVCNYVAAIRPIDPFGVHSFFYRAPMMY